MATPLRSPDRLGETPDGRDPLGCRARVPTSDNDGITALLRGNVQDQLGCLRERRLPLIGVFCTYPTSANRTNISKF
jgi:hypothetical protein